MTLHYAIDVGCGDGSYRDFLLQKADQIISLDINKKRIWRNSGKSSFFAASIYNMPFNDESFDLVFEKDVLHHLADPVRASNELFRISKKGGYVVCIEANRYNPLFFFHMTLLEGHEHFTKKFFMKLMNNYSNNVQFFFTESHIYPIKNKKILNLMHKIEDSIESSNIVRDYLAFNIAIIQKQ